MLAVVGDQRRAVFHAQLTKAAHGRKLARNTPRRHRDHFDRQRELAQPGHELAFVGNANELARLGGHNFFTRQGRTAALDHVSCVINFICAVHIHRQLLNFGGVKYPDAQGLQTLGGSDRAGDRTGDAVLDGGQGFNELVHSRTGAHTHHHAGLDVLKSGLANQGFEFVLGHGEVVGEFGFATIAF